MTMIEVLGEETIQVIPSPEPGVALEALVDVEAVSVEVPVAGEVVEVVVPGEQGPPGPAGGAEAHTHPLEAHTHPLEAHAHPHTHPENVVVGPANTLPANTAGLWVQTGLGPGGTDWTLWIEDGT